MKSTLLCAGLLAGILAINPLVANSASAEEKPAKAAGKTAKKSSHKATSRMQKSRGFGEPIPNLTLLNDPKAPVVVPPKKAGLITHAEVCSLHVANGTDQMIYISIDDETKMLVSAFGGTFGIFPAGAHTFKGIAYSVDGSSATFGPVEVSDCSGTFDWSLAR